MVTNFGKPPHDLAYPLLRKLQSTNLIYKAFVECAIRRLGRVADPVMEAIAREGSLRLASWKQESFLMADGASMVSTQHRVIMSSLWKVP